MSLNIVVLYKNIGVLYENLGVSDENIGVSDENIGVSDEAAGGVSDEMGSSMGLRYDDFFLDSIHSRSHYIHIINGQNVNSFRIEFFIVLLIWWWIVCECVLPSQEAR